MCFITFKDGVVIELHEDGTFDVVELSHTDIAFNTVYGLKKEDGVFNFIDERLNGALTI